MSRNLIWSVAAAMLIAGSVEPLNAQSPPAPPSSGGSAEVTLEQIDLLRAATEQAADLDDTTKKHIAEVLRQCADELQSADQWRAKAAEFVAARDVAPQELQHWKAEADAKEPPPTAVPADTSIEELKTLVAQAEEALKAARERQAGLDALQRRRLQRWDEVRQADDGAAKRLESLYKQMGALAALERTDPLARAQRMLLLACRQSIQAERASYAEELPSYEATREVLRLQLDLAVRAVNAAEKQAALFKEAVDKAEQRLAEQQAHEARNRAINTRSELRPLAAENERLIEQRNSPTGSTAKLKEVRQSIPALKLQLGRIKTEFAHVRQVADLSTDFGQMLVRQRRQLPDLEILDDGLRARQDEIARTKLMLLDLEDRRARLADVDAEVEAALLPLQESLDAEERADLEPAVRELLTTRREYLDDLISDANSYYNALVLELDKTERDLVQTVRLYRNYIDERILWVPSYPPETGLRASAFSGAIEQLISPSAWTGVLERFLVDMRRAPTVWGAAVLVLSAFLWCLRRTRRFVGRMGESVKTQTSAGLGPTVATIAATAILASPAPVVLWFLASRLTAEAGADSFSRAFATTMAVVAPIWGTIAIVRQSLRRNGLAEAHFGLPKEIACASRRLMWRLAAVGLPAAAVASLFDALDSLAWQASLGRAAFCVGILCVARMIQAAAHPARGWIAQLLGTDVEDFQYRLRRLWYVCALLIPLALIVISCAGYHYAAVQLAYRLRETIWLIACCFALRAFLRRWFVVARRRVAVQRAEHGSHLRLDAVTEASAGARAAALHEVRPPITPPELSLQAIDIQTRRLLNGFCVLALLLGTWWIWTDMLPALQFLDRLQLYSYAVTATDAAGGIDANGKPADVVKLHWITAADVIWAAIILAMTIIAARNLPGLLEITCLQWLPIDQGARYAVVAAVRYVIHIVGIVAICAAIGLQWSNIQWLAAAMTVGLGFGLQEIFANFISGLIILFERPIRVGDTVTIGDVSGTVSRIRGRATTIVDWDRKELIVPNKEFITGKLINWTLTDDVLRTVVRVGIAQSSDFEEAAQLLLQAARENPLVLSDPAPSVAFTQVGDGRLDFELRVFSAGLDSLTPLRFQLNAAILRAFARAGVEIAAGAKPAVVQTVAPVQNVVPIAPAEAETKPIAAASPAQRTAA